MADLEFEILTQSMKVRADLFDGISEEEALNLMGWYKTGPSDLDYARLDDRYPQL